MNLHYIYASSAEKCSQLQLSGKGHILPLRCHAMVRSGPRSGRVTKRQLAIDWDMCDA